MASKKISVGIIQENPIVGDIAGNLELAKNSISKLSKESSPDTVSYTHLTLPTSDLV